MTGAIPRRLHETEASLLMATVALALAGRELRSVLLVGEAADRSAAVLADAAQVTCPGVEVYAIAEVGRGNLGAVREHSPRETWQRPVALLMIDGPRDYPAISKVFADLEPWVVANGYIAFGEYDSRTSPDVTDFVNEIVDSGRCRKVQVAGTIAVIQKLQPAEPLDAAGLDRDQLGSRPAALPRSATGVLTATVELLRETLARAAWTERRGELVAVHRLKLIDLLETTVAERTAWAERMVAEAEQRGAIIEELQRALAERTAWAERMVAEAEQRGAVIEDLQRALAEHDQTRGGR